MEPIVEGNKVQAEITHILFPKQIKYLKERKLWSVDTMRGLYVSLIPRLIVCLGGVIAV